MPLGRNVHRGIGDIRASQAGGFGHIEDYFQSRLSDPSFELPGSYELRNGHVQEIPGQGLAGALLKGAALFGAAMLGGTYLPSLLGGGGGAGAAAGSAASVPSIPATAGLGGSGVAGAAGGGGMAGMFGGFGVRDAMQLAPLAMGLLGGGRGGNQMPQNDALNELLSMQKQRMQQTDPLYQAILQMAMAMMPTQYRTPRTGAVPMPQGMQSPPRMR